MCVINYRIALKTLQKYRVSDYASDELSLLKKLNSPYVISYYDSFSNGDLFCILTEYCQVRFKNFYLKYC